MICHREGRLGGGMKGGAVGGLVMLLLNLDAVYNKLPVFPYTCHGISRVSAHALPDFSHPSCLSFTVLSSRKPPPTFHTPSPSLVFSAPLGLARS